MKQGWEIKKLVDICDFQNGFAFKSNTYKDDGFPIIRITNIQNQSIDINNLVYFDTNDYKENFERFKVLKDDLVIAMSGATTGKIGINTSDLVLYLNQRVGKFLPKNNLDKTYLYYFLTTNVEESLKIAVGAAQPNLSTEQINNFEIPIPNLETQKQIVAILDKAFATIDQAKTNAQKNLQNAKELFNSSLQIIFSKNKNWEEKKLIELTTKIGSGATPRGGSESYKTIGTSLIRSMNVHDFEFREKNLAFIDDVQAQALSNVIIQENDVLLNITGASVTRCCVVPKEYLPARVNQHVSILRANKDLLDYKFLNFILTSKFYKDQLLFTGEQGATRQAITKVQLENFKICFPKSLKDQQVIVSKIDILQKETKKLEAIYTQKIADLDELKKSILQKAFAGELSIETAKTQTATTKVSVVKPKTKVVSINPTDLQAGIVSIALQRHQQKNQTHTFHHVKAEKNVHLAQSILCLELDRVPCKDAAGPNDFPHSKRVESRAKKAGFYTVHKKADYYEYSEGTQMQKLIDKTYLALDEKAEKLNNLIDIIVPMTTQQAEIFATVYAGWNNLLLDNKPFTDEDIVTESRENWHKQKLNIEREKFFKAITWMREKNIIPAGIGNKVSVKIPVKK